MIRAALAAGLLFAAGCTFDDTGSIDLEGAPAPKDEPKPMKPRPPCEDAGCPDAAPCPCPKPEPPEGGPAPEPPDGGPAPEPPAGPKPGDPVP